MSTRAASEEVSEARGQGFPGRPGDGTQVGERERVLPKAKGQGG